MPPRPFVQLNPKASQGRSRGLNPLKAGELRHRQGLRRRPEREKQGFIEELFAQSPQAAAELVRGICGVYGCQQAKGYCGGGLFQTEQTMDFGMIKFLSKPFPMHGAYMALMLN